MSLRQNILRTSALGLATLALCGLSTGCLMEMDLEDDFEDEIAEDHAGDEKLDLSEEDSEAFKDSKCSDVDIHVHNQYTRNGDNKDIKVVDFKYYDYEDSKWRNESTSNKIIDWGGSKLWNKALEYVGGETTKIKVYFKYNLGGTSWSSTYTRTSTNFFCYDGYHKDITIQ